MITISINKNTLLKIVDPFIPLGTRQIIKNTFAYQFYQSGFKTNVLNNKLKAFLQKVEPIKLDIKYKQYKKLQEKRNEAIKKGVLITSEDDYVQAILTDGQLKLNGRIRLKGDLVDHLSSNKWSYRVKLKDENTFLGMNKFSLQSPVTRNYLWEWVFHELLRHEGLPSLRYYFRPLIVNGNYLGIYAIEEHFDKIMLESNGFKEAPILKFSEKLFWENFLNNLYHKRDDMYKKSFSTAFQLNKISNDKILSENLRVANKLLNGFQNNLLTTSEVFDLNLLAKYFVIIDLMNASHASNWHNIRFYYDPFQSKLIPIGFDGDTNKSPLEILSIQNADDFKKNIFKDLKFTKLYIQNLKRISKKSYLDNFFKLMEKDFKKNKNILYKSFPALNTNPKFLYKNQKLIKNILNPYNAINVFLESIDSNEIVLNVANNQSLPLNLRAIKINDSLIELKENAFILDSTKINDSPLYRRIKVELNKYDFEKSNKPFRVFLIYRIHGQKNDFSEEVNYFNRSNPEFLNILEKDALDIQKASFLKINKKEKKINIKSGNWIIRKPLIIPPKYELIANKKTTLSLIDKGYLLSYGNVTFIGSEDDPIKIINKNKSYGNGFAIINANDKSLLKNVDFINMSNISNKRLIFSGGVTVYQSEIDIQNVNFNNSLSEDSLNIVRSLFNIEKITLENSQSDAIDIDFSNGFINNVEIRNSNNDGLDISGSKIKIKNVYIENSKDKGISIGESSNIQIDSVKINGSFIAIANKDGSEALINDLQLKNSNFDFAGFNKKNEFTGSITKINQIDFPNKKFNYLLASPSFLKVDNVPYNANSTNQFIFNLLYKDK